MHLSALKDLRSTFELEPKDTNTLGKAIFLAKVGLDNHQITVEHARSFVTIFTILPIQLTIITKLSAEKSCPVLARLTSLTGTGGFQVQMARVGFPRYCSACSIQKISGLVAIQVLQ